MLEALAQVEKSGFDAVGVTFRPIEGKLWEIKVSMHRLFYVLIEHREMILLHAYKKQGQKLPDHVRTLAIKRMWEVLS